jgi:hypothetical protein
MTEFSIFHTGLYLWLHFGVLTMFHLIELTPLEAASSDNSTPFGIASFQLGLLGNPFDIGSGVAGTSLVHSIWVSFGIRSIMLLRFTPLGFDSGLHPLI